ncbi:Serine/threonine-protein kinase ssp1 [Fusarium oxysporum f. sp. cubense race 1]|uniref:non-specific serine/threonine protein kinase n=1 Tax=Fusarium oxysporum f. sp. cubense (strain race 1) TaxID=1229664 RepID=N4UMT5_FUSC1|nr:Serine/threonine-protein kinase ssp1 [Fusarium oxysporum f. sp. cubense race 1]
MDPSQYYQHHHHHSHRHHHKSLSQQQSSASLSSTARGAPPLHTHLPSSSSMPLRTANSTPMSSPGLFSPSPSRQNLVTSVSENNTPPNYTQSPLLHPLQMHKVRETHKALIDSDTATGRKLINQYEVIEEIGRGMHGKVKLARNLETGENVAIKIIPRFSKKRRLGKVTAKSPQDKTKKEIAILKKIRHPNVVALLEVIDDPELKKIYMVLEHVELGEVVDTVLGLEYLHYQGVVHRDIKPANLLWSKDHRVKISDFGVSYFGRPIRDGEYDETVSESEAKDFDDDLELAKTVGTPAFFAPELCYTDLDTEQPKVSEQIDVWSLGVTLYCLIYARIPFLAEDEFQMFRKIATEEVYIPKRRLMPVHPSTSPAATSLYKRQNMHPYRDDNDLVYEEVDNLLIDLLRQMLTKNPEKRIRLRDIKRHPWVVQDIMNPIGWLDDTDPARPSSGRKIQVDERDMSSAVVPLTFLERARSVVKKAVGKVMHPLVERSDSKTRHRANSSAASSTGDNVSMYNNGPPTPHGQFRENRRKSLRPDDYFASAMRDAAAAPEHPLSVSQSVSPQPESVIYDPLATVLPEAGVYRGHHHAHSESESIREPEKSSSAASLWPFHRHAHSHGHTKTTQHWLHLGSPMPISQTTPTTPYFSSPVGGPDDSGAETVRKTRDLDMTDSMDESSRSKSVDRGLFSSSDKRAEPKVGVNTTVAPGSVQAPPRHGRRPVKSVDLGKASHHRRLEASILSSSLAAASCNKTRPRSLQRMDSAPITRTSPPRHSEDLCMRRCDRQAEHISYSCPPSPIQEEWTRDEPLPRADTMPTTKSSSVDSMEALATPSTSPSVTSPVSALPSTASTSERMLAFQSDPSLPALLSGASSVSADMEAELLCKPGIVSAHPQLLETTDSLTPPAFDKEPNGFPIDHVYGNSPAMDSGSLTVHLEGGARDSVTSTPVARPVDDDFDDDGSDDGILLMAKSKKKPAQPTSRPPVFNPRRRDTNISIASTETAKKVPTSAYGDEGTSPYET